MGYVGGVFKENRQGIGVPIVFEIRPFKVGLAYGKTPFTDEVIFLLSPF